MLLSIVQVDGQSVPSWGALYVATLLDNDGKALAEVGTPSSQP